MGYNKTKNTIISKLWNNRNDNEFICPQCGGHLIIVQLEPIQDFENPYTPYKSVIECTNCSFLSHATSYTILGSIQSFDQHEVSIASWTPSGSRTIETFEHILEYNQLKEVEQSKDLVEFLIVDDRIVQII